MNKAVLTATADAQNPPVRPEQPDLHRNGERLPKSTGDTASVLTGSCHRQGAARLTMTTGVGTAIITGSNGTLGVNDGIATFAVIPG